MVSHYRKRGPVADRLGEFNGVLGHGLSAGSFAANEASLLLKLLANFEPLEPLPDLGLDAVYMWPSGHIWFSLEEGFHDARYGWISDGDLLCRNGWVIKRNRELVTRFEPLEDVDNFGLDALHLAPVQRGDMNGDGRINAFDIDPFVIALVDRV